MVANDCMLQVVGERIEFWRDQLQTAFRSGDTRLAAKCTRHLEEYNALTTLALQPSATSSDSAGRSQIGVAEKRAADQNETR